MDTSRPTTLFCDLDDTLYPANSGLWGEIAGRINRYMHERMGFPLETLAEVREAYFRQYGTTLRGLQANHAIDVDDYLAFVHDVPLDRYLRPDPALRAVLERLPLRKYIFTNADANHARRVLKATGLEGIFDGILDIHTIAPYCKPMPDAFAQALKAVGDPDPHTVVLVDDQARITRAARALGFYTILVGRDGSEADADLKLETLSALPELPRGDHF